MSQKWVDEAENLDKHIRLTATPNEIEIWDVIREYIEIHEVGREHEDDREYS